MNHFSQLLDELAIEADRRRPAESAAAARQRFDAARGGRVLPAPGREPENFVKALATLRGELAAADDTLERLAKAMPAPVQRRPSISKIKAEQRARIQRIGEMFDRLIEQGKITPELSAQFDKYMDGAHRALAA